MGFMDGIKARARAEKKRIVLPESEDRRTLEAAAKIIAEDIAEVILIGNEEKVRADAKEGGFDISKASVVDPLTSETLDAYVSLFAELRKNKGMTEEKAREILTTDYPYFGVLMVKAGDADGMVSGACHSTADTLRPCLQILKTKPGTKLVSAFFLMVVPNCEFGKIVDRGCNPLCHWSVSFCLCQTLYQLVADVAGI